jgi:Fe2+ transport system protein FeoA
LSTSGLDLGTRGRVEEKQVAAGAIVVDLDGRRLALGLDAATKVLVRVEGSKKGKMS